MKLWITMLIGFFSLGVQAQETWKVKYGQATWLQASGEDAQKNVHTITRAEMGKQVPLTVSYTGKTEKGWKRYLTVSTTGDQELLKKQTSTLTISPAQLRAWLKTNSSIVIHTYAIPTDPDLASRVRIRRIHLFTASLP